MPKDQRIEVNNNESHWVGNNRLKVIDKTETAIIGGSVLLQFRQMISLAGGDKTIQTVQNLRLAAGDSIILSCGKTILQNDQ